MRRAYFLAVVVVLLFFIASDGLLWLRNIIRRVEGTTSGLSAATIETRGFFETLRDIQGLRQTLSALEVENRELKSEVIRLTETVRAAGATATQLEAARSFGDEAIAARVIARSPTKLHEEMVINVGSESGVATNMAVLVDGYLVGITQDVGLETSAVTLLTNASTTLPVILSTSRAQGILRGGLTGITVGDIPADASVADGESVLTSSLGGVVPADIPIGTVGDVGMSSSDVLQRVNINSPIRFGVIEYVVVVRKTGV